MTIKSKINSGRGSDFDPLFIGLAGILAITIITIVGLYSLSVNDISKSKCIDKFQKLADVQACVEMLK